MGYPNNRRFLDNPPTAFLGVLMAGLPLIDTSFDFHVDSAGRDPDKYSPTLRRYHRLLWSKPLPSGEMFAREDGGDYLRHSSHLGEFFLSSDSVTPTFTKYKRMQHLVEQFSAEDNEAFVSLASTVGGVLVFPSNIVAGKQTINGARGFTAQISDRIDLTLECIRRHYAGAPSPLGDTLARYADFFTLFDNFPGYVDFFLLGDLVDDGHAVRFFLPFDDFAGSARPTDLASYTQFRAATTEFLHARNQRIRRWSAEHLG